MAEITEESITPNESGGGTIGTNARRWGQGHYSSLFKGGKEVAVLDAPSFTDPTSTTPAPEASELEIVNAEWVRAFGEAYRNNLALLGTPTAPTPGESDNSAQVATTAWVQALTAALKTLLEQRSNHTGTIPASVISDFAGTVAALPAGLKAHDQNTDGQLVGSDGALTADTIADHIANTDIHFVIDDTAGETDDDKAFSAARIIELIDATVSQGISAISLEAVTGAGALAALSIVTTALIQAGAITPSRLSGGPSNDAVSNGYVYGVDPGGTLGFFKLTPDIGAISAAGRSLLSKVDDLLYVQTGTTSSTAAVGNDSRFPTTAQKSALAGAEGAPSDTNRYLTQVWAENAAYDASDLSAETPSEDPGLVSPADLQAAFISNGAIGGADLDAAEPSEELTLVSAAALIAKFATLIDVEAREDAVDVILSDLQDALDGKLDLDGFGAQWEDGTIFDGDVLDVDYPPANYAPRSEDVNEANDTGDLAAHLAGIDDKIGTIDGILDGIEANGVPADISGSDVLYTPDHYTPTAATVAGHFEGIDDDMLTAANIIDPAKLHSDKLHIQWEPSNYTPTSVGVAEADDNSDLTAHLKGIENALASKSNPTAASQVEAEAGSSASLRLWSPLRIKQAIYALAGDVVVAISSPIHYQRTVVPFTVGLSQGDHHYIFTAPVAGTLTMIEVEAGISTGSMSFRASVNNSATGPTVTPSTGSHTEDGGNISVKVGRADLSVAVAAGAVVGVYVNAVTEYASGLRGMFAFVASP